MEIKSTVNEAEKSITMQVIGRINTATVQDFEKVLVLSYDACQKLILDFTGVEFISSAGLRVLMDADATMKQKGGLVIKNINDAVREVLDMTGFIDFLTIE